MKKLFILTFLLTFVVLANSQPLIRFSEIDPWIEYLWNVTTPTVNRGLTMKITATGGNPSAEVKGYETYVTLDGTDTIRVGNSGDFRAYAINGSRTKYLSALSARTYVYDSSYVDKYSVGSESYAYNYSTKTIPWLVGSFNRAYIYGSGNVTYPRGMYSDVAHYGTGTSDNVVNFGGHVYNLGGGHMNFVEGAYSKIDNGNASTMDRAFAGSFDIGNTGAGSHIRFAVGGFAGRWSQSGGATIDSTAGFFIDNTISLGSSFRRAFYSQSVELSELYGNLQLTPLAGTGNRIATVSPTGLFMGTKKDSTYYWNLAYSWGNHGAQGYITDGNTNWDNSYGFITDGNSGWDNSYGFITDGNTGWDNSYGFITDGNTGWDNSYGFITDGNVGWDNSYGFITKRPPITANYLVGTANDSLTNEIVVGTTPGGILGGTWASPTIDNYSITQPMLDTYIEGTPDQGKWLGYSAYGMDWLSLPTANASGTQGIATFLAGDFNSTDGEISIDYANATKATAMQHGFLSNSDWGTFNAKIGGSGAAGAVAIFDAINTITNDADFTFNPTSNELTVGSGSGNGSVTSGNFILSSDLRLKTNIKPLAKHEWADDIEFKSFSMKSDKTNRTRYGVIAQEIEKINPELVHTNAKGYKSVAYIDLLVAKVARQDEIIRNLIERINKLEDANEKK